MMKKDVGGEIRSIPDRIKYFSFAGLKPGEEIERCYSVDINSAYLQVLKNEGIITENTFKLINDKTKVSAEAKIDRLKSVGMFARNPLEIIYKNKKVFLCEPDENPYSWVFFEACKKTTDAMEKIKKEMKKEFILYWVDGIFLRGNQDRAVNILGELNFPAKIEIIDNLRVIDGAVIYLKDGKEKMLFLPSSQKESHKEFIQKTKHATIL
jgi:hypothetical protein